MAELREGWKRLTGTPVFGRLRKMTGRVRVLEGGSRSSKTFSIIQSLVEYCGLNTGKTITVGRARLTWLKASIIPDFQAILGQMGVWDPACWNKSEMTYRLWGNTWQFMGLDDPQRLHGRKQDVAWLNEAVECTVDDFDQLEMRTTEYLLLDYNPSASQHWIYDRVLSRPDAEYMHSTMLDNPFLEPAIRLKILSYEPTETNLQRGTADENKWKIYGLGQRSQLEGAVYTNYTFCKEFPESERTWYGLDFGYTNDPSACVRVCLQGGELWVDQLLYDTGLTNRDIADRLEGRAEKGRPMWCDSAEPKSIEDLHRYGWNAVPTKKGPDSVRNGIDILKTYRLNITERSIDMKRELANYTWRRDKNGIWLNEPVDNFNHLLDALRYVALMELSRTTFAPVLGARRDGPRTSFGEEGPRAEKRRVSRHGY